MKLLELHVEGYRSLKNVTWKPGDLNVLIGPNASGKTNVIRVLELLAVAARGGLGKHIQREGGMGAIVWDGRTPAIRFRAASSPRDLENETPSEFLTYNLDLLWLGQTSFYAILHEWLGKVESETISTMLERDSGHAAVLHEHEEKLSPLANVPQDETLLSFVGSPFVFNHFLNSFQYNVASWATYPGLNTQRGAAVRAPTLARHETRVESSGDNLVAVLHTLYASDRDFKREINQAMQAAFGEDFEELVFPPAADQLIQLRVRWKSLKREVSAADLSDGTLRFLFLLAVLATPNPPALIAIEEPEIGLHPSMLPIVAEFAAEAAARTQVILTTHSSDFLSAFRDPIPFVTVCRCENGETILQTKTGQDLEYWLKEYTLGELYRSRQLETAE